MPRHHPELRARQVHGLTTEPRLPEDLEASFMNTLARWEREDDVVAEALQERLL